LLAPVISGVYVVARAARHSHARDAVEARGTTRPFGLMSSTFSRTKGGGCRSVHWSRGAAQALAVSLRAEIPVVVKAGLALRLNRHREHTAA